MTEGEWRITDGDRHSAVSALGEHYAAGRLDQAEFDERSEQAYAAKTQADLRPLFRDLPEPHGSAVAPQAPTPVVGPRRPQGSMRGFGFPFPLLPILFVVLLVGFHGFWLFPLVLVGFCLTRGRRHWHRGWPAGPMRRY